MKAEQILQYAILFTADGFAAIVFVALWLAKGDKIRADFKRFIDKLRRH